MTIKIKAALALGLMVCIGTGCATIGYVNGSDNTLIHVSEESKQKKRAQGDPVFTRLYSPRIPKKAVQRKIQSGHVTLLFDITADGRPVNIKIKEAKPKGVFEMSAISAMNMSRYEPSETGFEDAEHRYKFELKF